MVEDRDLITRIARGDQDALHQLYDRHRPMLRRYLWHHLQGNISLIEEAVQDAFLAIWRSAAGYRGEAPVTTWMFSIAHHCALHLTRSAAHRAAQQDLPLAEDNRNASFAAEEQLQATLEDAVLDRITLVEALDQLSTKHREILELIFQYGFSLEEVARILSIPVGTVKSRVSYARRALQRELTPILPLEDENS